MGHFSFGAYANGDFQGLAVGLIPESIEEFQGSTSSCSWMTVYSVPAQSVRAEGHSDLLFKDKRGRVFFLYLFY